MAEFTFGKIFLSFVIKIHCEFTSCSGCTDELAFNSNCLEGSFPQGGNGCDEEVLIDDGSCIYTPEGFSYSQSTQQAFYFIIDADIDGEPLVFGDCDNALRFTWKEQADVCTNEYPRNACFSL
mgnify:CR=1 FL=1